MTVRWEVAWNPTMHMWMVWRDASPAVCFCVLQSDAERIADLLTKAGYL